MSPGFVPGAGHHHAETFWQNISTTVGCGGGHLDCMRQVSFENLNDATTTIVDDYDYQLQPRVDGDFVADTYEANLYQGRFNFSGPFVVSHEAHEVNGQAFTGVNTTEDIPTYLRIFFPAITDDVIDELLELYPEDGYTSAGLRFSDMKQSFDLTAHNLALTQALNNETWNARVDLGQATHGTDQSYYWYSTYTLVSTTGEGPTAVTGTTAGQNSSSTGNSTTEGMGMGGPGTGTTVDSAVAIQMQKYLVSFILTGDPNTMWSNDKLYWPKYNEGNSTVGTQIIFNTTFSTGTDDLANERSLLWNQALWY